MDIIVSSFAVLVAAGCLITLFLQNIKRRPARKRTTTGSEERGG